jgi:hypothetical protein
LYTSSAGPWSSANAGWISPPGLPAEFPPEEFPLEEFPLEEYPLEEFPLEEFPP